MELVYLFAGLALGFVIAWLIKQTGIAKNFVKKEELLTIKSQFENLNTEKSFLEKEVLRLKEELNFKIQYIEECNIKIQNFLSELSSLKTKFELENKTCQEYENKLQTSELKYNNLQNENLQIQKYNSEINAKLDTYEQKFKEFEINLQNLNERNKELQTDLIKTKENYTSVFEQNKNLHEKLNSQKQEIEAIGKSFTNEFKVLADSILETNSKKFTEQNKTNLDLILSPLTKNLESFKQKIEETYNKESNERFSLGEKVKELAALNQQINQEAKNLTQALKGSVKQRGSWGEMLLERILENSGLSKGNQYTVQEFLRDEAGNTITGDDGKKLQPDVIVLLPNERKIIIDSKVSLIAYDKFSNSEEIEAQKSFINEHIISIKTHIDNLASKNYQDFEKSLDFVMLFVPIEPAYMLAMQNEPDLWEYAYKKRVLLISPTNLIAALKLVSDLWQRDQQNRNSLEIAKRGSLLLEKFHGFLETLENLGKNINRTSENYLTAMNQLKTGPGNLVGQVEKIKKLGVKTQKTLPSQFLDFEEEEI